MNADAVEKTIFITIGTQLPFKRIFDYVQYWAENTKKSHKFLAQTGSTELALQNCTARDYIGEKEFVDWFQRADCIVAHAGMGTIIQALINKKPLIIVPRLASAGEHRNDHQLDTASKFESLSHVHIIQNREEFFFCLESVLDSNTTGSENIGDGDGGGELGYKLNDWLTGLQHRK